MKGDWKLFYKTFHRQGMFTGIEKVYHYEIPLFEGSCTEEDVKKAEEKAKEELSALYERKVNVIESRLIWTMRIS